MEIVSFFLSVFQTVLLHMDIDICSKRPITDNRNIKEALCTTEDKLYVKTWSSK